MTSKYPKTIAGYEARWNEDQRYNLLLFDKDKKIAEVYWKCENNILSVVEIYIEPEYRNKGIGTEIYVSLVKATKANLEWKRNALASPEMKQLVLSFCKECQINLNDDWETVIVPANSVSKFFPS